MESSESEGGLEGQEDSRQPVPNSAILFQVSSVCCVCMCVVDGGEVNAAAAFMSLQIAACRSTIGGGTLDRPPPLLNLLTGIMQYADF